MYPTIDEIIQDSKAETLISFTKKGVLAIEVATKRAGLSVDEFKKLLEESK